MTATQRLLTGRSAQFADNGGGGGGGGGDTTFIEQIETGGEFDTASATYVPVTGTDVGFTLTEAKKVRIWYEFTAIHLIADTDISAFYGIDIDGTTYQKGEYKISVAAGGNSAIVVHIEKMISLAAGSYTATLMLKSDGSHNARIKSGTDAPTYSTVSYVSGSGSGGSSPMTLIESKTILADTDTVDFTGLDGEFDGYYFLEMTTRKGAGGTVNVDLQPNAVTTDQLYQLLLFGTATSPTKIQGSSMLVYTSGGPAGDAQRATVTFWPKTGNARTALVEIVEASIAFPSVYRFTGSIAWLDDATAITSLRLKASVANGIQAGSIYNLYKVTPT